MSKQTFLQNLNEMVERDFNQVETMKVLTHNQSIFWSWGVSNKYKLGKNGLLLTVNGYKHKGHVLITLGWNDTYTFRLLNGQYNEVYKATEVYFDELTARIDEKIEKQENYVY